MKKNIFILTLIFLTISCSDRLEESIDPGKIILTQDEVMSIAFDDFQELGENEIIRIVQSFQEDQGDILTRSSVNPLKISKKTFVNVEGEHDNVEIATRSEEPELTAPVFEVEFGSGEGKGMAVVGGDIRLPSVIAYMPKVGKNSMQRTGADELLRASKSSYLYKLIKTKELIDSLRNPTLEKISEKLNIPYDEITYEKIEDRIIVSDEIYTRTTAIPGVPPGVQPNENYSIPPLVKTNWGQENQFTNVAEWNEYMDFVRDYDSNGNPAGMSFRVVPAGCVNVAMGQMMTYTEPQVDVPGLGQPDWYGMTKYPTLLEGECPGHVSLGVPKVLLYLYRLNNTTSVKDWDGAVIESSVNETDMLRTMNTFFRFNNKAAFNADNALESLRDGRLILMLTSNHVFIISGLMVTNKANLTRELVRLYDVYWHANFGWSDECTGYYLLDDNANVYFEAGGIAVWSYNLQCLNNIRNK